MAEEIKDLPKLTENAQKVIEMVEKMTVLELGYNTYKAYLLRQEKRVL